jgi:hypothetical protein
MCQNVCGCIRNLIVPAQRTLHILKSNPAIPNTAPRVEIPALALDMDIQPVFITSPSDFRTSSDFPGGCDGLS